MTTIVFFNGVLAADTQVNGCNGCPVGRLVKIGRTPDGYLWAFTGAAHQQAGAADWANKREGDPPKTEEGCFILITPEGRVREWWGNGWLECDATMYAWGSGERMARAAMMAGAGPERAIEIASKLDNDTGPEVMALAVSGSMTPQVAGASSRDASQ